MKTRKKLLLLLVIPFLLGVMSACSKEAVDDNMKFIHKVK